MDKVVLNVSVPTDVGKTLHAGKEVNERGPTGKKTSGAS